MSRRLRIGHGTSYGIFQLSNKSNVNYVKYLLQISPQGLFSLDSFKQTLEVPSTKPIKVMPLNNLNENRRPIHQMLRKQLQQITPLIKVNQNIQTLERLKILIQNHALVLQPLLHPLVVCLRDADELHTAGLQVCDGGDDVVGSEGDVLHAGAAVEVDVFFDLGFLVAEGWLVYGHFDGFVGGCHDDGLEGGEVTMQSMCQ